MSHNAIAKACDVEDFCGCTKAAVKGVQKRIRLGIKGAALAIIKKGGRPELFTDADIKKLHDWATGYIERNNMRNVRQLYTKAS